MGRHYLPCTHSIGRAFGYAGHAFPEAIVVTDTHPGNPPAPPEMFNPIGIPLYFEEVVQSDLPDAGPILRYRRDWTATPWCYIPVSPPEEVPFDGYFQYTIQFWPDSFDPAGSPPRAAVVYSRFEVYWTNWPSFPWIYDASWATLTGQVNPVSWVMQLEAIGLASPPCALGEWVGGWSWVACGPAPWELVSAPLTYADSTPHDFT